MNNTERITIRTGTREDLPQVLGLIKELAEYERAPQEVDNTVERMEEDGFGPDKVFDFLVAEMEGKIIGLALYFWTYSTWKGKCLYLEDLVIAEEYRRYGIGRRLFTELIQLAKQKGACRLNWQVLEWNEPAIQFYKTLNAEFDSEWINCRLSFQQLQGIQ